MSKLIFCLCQTQFVLLGGVWNVLAFRDASFYKLHTSVLACTGDQEADGGGREQKAGRVHLQGGTRPPAQRDPNSRGRDGMPFCPASILPLSVLSFTWWLRSWLGTYVRNRLQAAHRTCDGFASGSSFLFHCSLTSSIMHDGSAASGSARPEMVFMRG